MKAFVGRCILGTCGAGDIGCAVAHAYQALAAMGEVSAHRSIGFGLAGGMPQGLCLVEQATHAPVHMAGVF